MTFSEQRDLNYSKLLTTSVCLVPIYCASLNPSISLRNIAKKNIRGHSDRNVFLHSKPSRGVESKGRELLLTGHGPDRTPDLYTDGIRHRQQLSARLCDPQHSCSCLIFITYGARRDRGVQGSVLIGWVDGGKCSCWLCMRDMDLMQSQVSTRGQELLNLRAI